MGFKKELANLFRKDVPDPRDATRTVRRFNKGSKVLAGIVATVSLVGGGLLAGKALTPPEIREVEKEVTVIVTPTPSAATGTPRPTETPRPTAVPETKPTQPPAATATTTPKPQPTETPKSTVIPTATPEKRIGIVVGPPEKNQKDNFTYRQLKKNEFADVGPDEFAMGDVAINGKSLADNKSETGLIVDIQFELGARVTALYGADIRKALDPEKKQQLIMEAVREMLTTGGVDHKGTETVTVKTYRGPNQPMGEVTYRFENGKPKQTAKPPASGTTESPKVVVVKPTPAPAPIFEPKQTEEDSYPPQSLPSEQQTGIIKYHELPLNTIVIGDVEVIINDRGETLKLYDEGPGSNTTGHITWLPNGATVRARWGAGLVTLTPHGLQNNARQRIMDDQEGEMLRTRGNGSGVTRVIRTTFQNIPLPQPPSIPPYQVPSEQAPTPAEPSFSGWTIQNENWKEGPVKKGERFALNPNAYTIIAADAWLFDRNGKPLVTPDENERTAQLILAKSRPGLTAMAPFDGYIFEVSMKGVQANVHSAIIEREREKISRRGQSIQFFEFAPLLNIQLPDRIESLVSQWAKEQPNPGMPTAYRQEIAVGQKYEIDPSVNPVIVIGNVTIVDENDRPIQRLNRTKRAGINETLFSLWLTPARIVAPNGATIVMPTEEGKRQFKIVFGELIDEEQRKANQEGKIFTPDIVVY